MKPFDSSEICDSCGHGPEGLDEIEDPNPLYSKGCDPTTVEPCEDPLPVDPVLDEKVEVKEGPRFAPHSPRTIPEEEDLPPCEVEVEVDDPSRVDEIEIPGSLSDLDDTVNVADVDSFESDVAVQGSSLTEHEVASLPSEISLHDRPDLEEPSSQRSKLSDWGCGWS